MSDYPELTRRQDSPASQSDFSRFSDSETDDRTPPTGRYTPDLFSRIKKFPSVKLSRNSSLLALKNLSQSNINPPPSATSAPLPTLRRKPSTALQHVRNLSLQHSLAKPLPEPPPDRPSLEEPPTPLAKNSLASVQEDEASDISFYESMTEAHTHSRMDSRTSTMDSSSSYGGQEQYAQDVNSSMNSMSSSARPDGAESGGEGLTARGAGPASGGPSPAVTQGRTPSAGAPVGGPSQGSSSTHLSGLMCNVHRTTGREPHALVGATTTILGDKLYVFGGRILSRSRPAPLTSDLYELDLIRRHWTKLETTGDAPPPRYFHSMCPLGDTKMVCYGGMSPAPNQATGGDGQPEVTVMSDIYIYDVSTKTWTYIPTQEHPQGRYAHCACILPSSASFSSHRAPLSALQHNPSTGNPNEGRIGINIDGSGGAEMVIVGGQDGANHYIEQISVFNLRSLKWTSTQPLGKSCGAYRSVAAPLPPSVTSKLGRQYPNGMHRMEGGISAEAREPGSSMLIYSNYNFLDVKLELQIRSPDGNLSERPMTGVYSPPGLRFPNGGVIDTHFVVSGTYLTSSKQEYALWALDLRTLTWNRIDAGGSVFSQGSWNRGVLWNRRNTFVILGNRKRSLVDDYNHRRINFSNVCMVELEAFGFYDNPRKTTPLAGFISASSPYAGPGLSLARKAGCTAGGRFHSRASEELGEKAFAMRELSDMDILCIGGERIPVNSRIVGRRWGPYFVQLLREGTATQDGSDAMTLRSGLASNPMRASAITITPNSRNTIDSAGSMISTMGSSSGSTGLPPSTAASSVSGGPMAPGGEANTTGINAAPTPRSLPPASRPRCLYLPHTYLTIQALLHFLYTSSLPPPSSPLCTPQILCSLLQIARPYRIDGLLEAVVERLHALLDSRNAAAVFNATAMAAGGGRGIDGVLNPNFFVGSFDPVGSPTSTSDFSLGDANAPANNSFTPDLSSRTEGLSINTNVQQSSRAGSDEVSSATSASGSEWSSSEVGTNERENFIWNGELSSVIGLQKRGLRGLMEGRRMRERTGTTGTANISATTGPTSYGGPVPGQGQGQGQRVGLGIAGS
ncbi:Fc.00g054540.m01.CDS01 [Cosmosporella sp. VM-42]